MQAGKQHVKCLVMWPHIYAVGRGLSSYIACVQIGNAEHAVESSAHE